MKPFKTGLFTLKQIMKMLKTASSTTDAEFLSFTCEYISVARQADMQQYM
jgi:hypothetical protein